MTGIYTWSTTASENINANTGINWDEGMAPAAVNNSARAEMVDIRTQWNDASWFQYGIGSKDVRPTYASGTSVTFSGGDATTYWHPNRRVKAVGSTTGTIYGNVSSSSYSAPTTTVNFTWDSGSLSNETLSIYASTMPVTGKPIGYIDGNITVAGKLTISYSSADTDAFELINTNTGGKTWLVGDSAGTTAGTFGFYNNTDAVLTFWITSAGAIHAAGGLTVGSATMITTTTSFTDGAGVAAGTLTNAPSAGNPTKWIPVSDNGTTRYIPAW